MNQNVTAIVIKLGMTFIFSALAFYLYTVNDIWWVFIIALSGMIINYFLGDQYLLPVSDNLTTSLANGVMSGLLVYIIDVLSQEFTANFTAITIFALTIAVSEYFYHQYFFNIEEL